MSATLHRLLVVAAALPFLLLAACQDRQVRALEERKLFDLAIGKSGHRLDLFQLEERLMFHATHIVMRDGIFYISNGPANKVMKLTSYGDLLDLIYNPDDNHQPLPLNTATDEGSVASRRTLSYPFRQVGHIAVSISNVLLVEDSLEPTRAVYDEALGVLLDRVVLRFDSSGHPMDYLGQEGIGGAPFPFIEGIYTTDSDQIVVVARALDRSLIYWFNGEGRLRYTVEIAEDRLPALFEDSEFVPTVERILPDAMLDKLYLKIDYFELNVDPQTGVSFGITNVATRVYWLDLQSGRYEGYIDVPQNVQQVELANDPTGKRYAFLYEMIGAILGERIYLLSRGQSGIGRLLVMNTAGRVLQRRDLQSGEGEAINSVYHVSSDGIVSALLGYRDRASVYWWRIDRLPGVLE